ncbi:MAG TPA: iron-sulfur cluster assembly protein, partial [Xanthobacteraceae bacterium]
MAVSKEQVLAALEGVKSPDGIPLPRTGTLSEVVVGGNKVFFSITVDAGAVKAWEPIRKRAEDAVRALPGVQSALIALTAERKAGAAPSRPAAAGASPRAAGRGESTQGVPGVEAIIAVASGKGGVGKSTTAVNLALGL